MSKKPGIAILVASVAALIISVVALMIAMRQPASLSDGQAASTEQAADQSTEQAASTEQAESNDIQYVMYLGTNDKDTNKPVFKPKKAKEKAEQILLKNFGGYTIQEAKGGWIDDDKIYTEYTLVIYLSDTNIDAIHNAAKEMIKTFHQSSVLIQANETTTEFYDGTN